MKFEDIQSTLRAAVGADSSKRAEVVELLLGELLNGFAGFHPRATDGFIPLREEITAETYFAVGVLYLIDDQSRHPASLDLVFAGDADLKSGRVQIGLRSGSELSPKLENLLMAYPRETAARAEWAHRLEYRDGEWRVAGSNAETHEGAAEQRVAPDGALRAPE
jgi:hypothetical protein